MKDFNVAAVRSKMFENKMTTEDLATATGLHPRVLSELLSETVKPSEDAIRRIYKALMAKRSSTPVQHRIDLPAATDMEPTLSRWTLNVDYINDLIEKLGLTYAEFSESISRNRDWYHDCVKNGGGLKRSTVENISKVYGLDKADFLKDYSLVPVAKPTGKLVRIDIDKIETIRQIRGISIPEMSKRGGGYSSWYHNMLNGKGKVMLSTAQSLARVLGVPIEFITTEMPVAKAEPVASPEDRNLECLMNILYRLDRKLGRIMVELGGYGKVRSIYDRYETLYDLHDELKDAISDIKHLLSLGAVAEDHSLFSDLLEGYERMLERAGAELDEVSARIEAMERADFERMTA